jgi:hypothetical protein
MIRLSPSTPMVVKGHNLFFYSTIKMMRFPKITHSAKKKKKFDV